MLPDLQCSILKVSLLNQLLRISTSPISADLFSKNKEDVKAREAELSAQGQYFSASYAAERGARSKEESGEKGGAAVSQKNIYSKEKIFYLDCCRSSPSVCHSAVLPPVSSCKLTY